MRPLRASLLTVAAVLALAAPAAAAPTLAPGITNSVSFPFGPATPPTNGLAAGDVRGAGRASVVTLPTGGYIGLMDSLGGGFLGPPFPASLPAPLGGAVTADVNHDGRADTVVDALGAGAYLVPGTAGGLGTPALVYTGYSGAPGIVARDLDGDGHPDVASQNTAGPPTGNPVIRYAIGQGNGTFGAAQDLVVSNGNASLPLDGLAAGDVNGDGRPDLVSSSSSTTKPLVVTLGNLASTGPTDVFLAPNGFALGGAAATDVAAADVTGDGRSEAVVTTTASQLLVVHFTAGGTPAATDTIPLSCAGAQVRLADLDLDGRPDAVVRCPDSVLVLPGTGDGFGAPQPFDPKATGSASMAVGDVDGDGRPDVAVGFPGSVQVLLNTSPAVASADPGAVDFGAVTAGALSGARSVTLRVSAGVARPATASASGAMLVTADGCAGRTLTAGQTCSVDVRFGPGAAGASSGTLTIPAAGGGTLATATLSGTGVAPAPTASAAVPSLALSGKAQALPGGLGLVLAQVGTPGKLRAVATVPGAKSAKAKAKAKPVTVASGAVNATTAGTWALVLKPTAAGRKLLKRSLKTSLKVTFTPSGGGPPLTRAAALTLKR